MKLTRYEARAHVLKVKVSEIIHEPDQVDVLLKVRLPNGAERMVRVLVEEANVSASIEA